MTTETEGKFRRWALRHGVGALPCRSAHGFPAKRVYGYFCAMLHNVFEWYKHDGLGKEEQTRRLPTVVQRDFAVVACIFDRQKRAKTAQRAPKRRRFRVRRKISPPDLGDLIRVARL